VRLCSKTSGGAPVAVCSSRRRCDSLWLGRQNLLGTWLGPGADCGARGACCTGLGRALLTLLNLLRPLHALALEFLLNTGFSIQDHATGVAVQENLMPSPTEEGTLVFFKVEVG